MRCACSLSLLFSLIVSLGAAVSAEPAAEKMLFDFEDPATLKAWSNLALPDAKEKEPPVKLGCVAEKATSGQRSLKLTFAGGHWPTITTTQVHDDWLPYQTFEADVTVSRTCLVGFAAFPEKSERGEGWDALVSRWTKTVFLHPGANRVAAAIPQPNEYGISAKRGKVIRFEIFLYQPHERESIYVDNIRLTNAKVSPPPKAEFTLVGSDEVLRGSTSAEAVIELGKRLKDGWTPPESRTLVQIESDFQARHSQLKSSHPKAVLAVLRDGQKGYDPAHPDKVYAGWKDAYWSSHGPDSAFVQRSENRGTSTTHEVFMRHRSPLMQVDLSSIPRGSTILAARLIVVRADDKYLDDRNPEKKPTMWVVEPCNRPWEENEVNAFQYARDQFWKEVGGMSWGDDPDFLPIFLAHGPSQAKVSSWDFTAAVRYWTDGAHPNHGFMLHGDSSDYIMAHTREATNLKDRPAVLVIYEPK